VRAKIATIISIFAALTVPEPAAADIQSFLDNHKERSSVWNLDCYQGGKKIITAAKLRIGRYKGKNGISNQFADENGRQVRIFTSPGTTCMAHQLSGPRVRAAARGKGRLKMVRPKGK
jgi:hypothetical protein